MRIFVDTSTLIKKYADEPGAASIDGFAAADEIAVSPVTWIEFNAALARGIRRKILSSEQSKIIRIEARKDYAYFHVVLWTEDLEQKAIEIAEKNGLKTLDAIQLASGILSESDLFYTSDRRLHREAQKVVRRAKLL